MDTFPSTKGMSQNASSASLKVTFDNESIRKVEEEMEKSYFKVSGMTCSSCVSSVERNVMKMEGEWMEKVLNFKDVCQEVQLLSV